MIRKLLAMFILPKIIGYVSGKIFGGGRGKDENSRTRR